MAKSCQLVTERHLFVTPLDSSGSHPCNSCELDDGRRRDAIVWNILGEGPLKRTDEADDEAVILLFGADDLDEGPLAWQERALCAQTDPEAFFPEKGGSTREAKRVCATCEVREECLQYALANDERFGIWGGLSERERRKLKRRAV